MKRDFLMLAQTYDSKKHMVSRWLWSPKLDGFRVFWDGGVTRGMQTADVPFANTLKDARFQTEQYATGLWSRYAKAIHAPDWFLDALPPVPLDGEFWMGPGRFQDVMSMCRAGAGMRQFEGVRYMVFDLPPAEMLFAPGEVRVNNGQVLNYDSKIIPWFRKRGGVCHPTGRWFRDTYSAMRDMEQNDVVRVVPQHPIRSLDHLKEMYEDALLDGQEGGILKAFNALYVCKRSKNMLKQKPWFDAEGEVIGYVTGKITEKDSRLRGMMGCLVLSYQGKVMELSGFTDAERETLHPDRDFQNPDTQYADDLKHFAIGDKVTFKYRELTNDGIPKEARYWRKRE